MVEELALFLTWKIQDSMPQTECCPIRPNYFPRGFFGSGRRLETRGTKSRAYFLLTGLGCALVHFYWPMPVTQREGGDVCGTPLLQVQSFSLDWSFSLPRRGEPQGKEEHWECGAKQEYQALLA